MRLINLLETSWRINDCFFPFVCKIYSCKNEIIDCCSWPYDRCKISERFPLTSRHREYLQRQWQRKASQRLSLVLTRLRESDCLFPSLSPCSLSLFPRAPSTVASLLVHSAQRLRILPLRLSHTRPPGYFRTLREQYYNSAYTVAEKCMKFCAMCHGSSM